MVVMIVIGTCQVQEDASETGISEMRLHKGLTGCDNRLLVRFVLTM